VTPKRRVPHRVSPKSHSPGDPTTTLCFCCVDERLPLLLTRLTWLPSPLSGRFDAAASAPAKPSCFVPYRSRIGYKNKINTDIRVVKMSSALTSSHAADTSVLLAGEQGVRALAGRAMRWGWAHWRYRRAWSPRISETFPPCSASLPFIGFVKGF